MSAHESLREAIVVARETASGDQQLVAYVVRDSEKRMGAGESAEDESRSEQIAQWENVWDETYGQIAEPADHTFNIVGWNSSYSGLPIPAAEMRSWVDETVSRILGLSPQRVLEIGCGTGLLLFRIAPHTGHYHGTDVSQRALSYINQNLNDERSESITLSRRPAEDFAGIEPGAFDTVILNSVVQYFRISLSPRRTHCGSENSQAGISLSRRHSQPSFARGISRVGGAGKCATHDDRR